MGDTSQVARGQWRKILFNLGVDKNFLTGRHGPCPLCGGSDRFRFDDRYGDGDYFCGQCGAGKGFRLLMGIKGWTFAQAAAEVDAVLGHHPRRRDDHSHCCSGPGEMRAHKAAQAFFAKQPDFVGPKPPEKSVRDAALWLRKFHPERLMSYLDKWPEARSWLERQP